MMLSRSRIAVAVAAGICALIAVTAPSLLRSTRIGLEFRGGSEILYVAASVPGSAEPSRTDLLSTARELARRANASGVAEPDIRVESPAQIRVLLAGDATKDQAQQLLQGPALPVQLEVKWTNTVGGVLGAADFSATMTAGVVALGIVFALLGIVYRAQAAFAVVGLLAYLWAMLAAFNALDATLSIAAIVAFVLGIGIAADANILLFERLREERRQAGSGREALWRSLRAAGRTVLDASLANLIVAMVLFIAGIGPIRGFALTTTIGVALSLLCNLGLVGALLLLSGVPERQVETVAPPRPLPFLRLTPTLFALFGLIALVGAWSIATRPFNYDIDFKAGTALDISLAGTPITQAEAIDTIAGSGIGAATVAIGGAQHDQVAARFDDALDQGKITRIVEQFRTAYGDKVAYQENTADPAVAQDLARQAVIAICLALAALAALVSIRFGWRYAAATLACVLISSFLVIAVFSLFSLEIDVTFIAAILTVMGYAVNNSVVVFDRIRENLQAAAPRAQDELPQDQLRAIVDLSLTQVLRRSLLTVATVIAGALSLYFLGAEPLQMFSLAIFCGLVFAAIATIFIAVPVWLGLTELIRPTPRAVSLPAE
ncbi:SecD/SecF fusion protein [Rhizobiales bacterium GAS191]|jgi:preprotein translocase SecF subunit|nr:SecD/SecF fusion protein [Rhizobiales bacterium GAS191]